MSKKGVKNRQVNCHITEDDGNIIFYWSITRILRDHVPGEESTLRQPGEMSKVLTTNKEK